MPRMLDTILWSFGATVGALAWVLILYGCLQAALYAILRLRGVL